MAYRTFGFRISEDQDVFLSRRAQALGINMGAVLRELIDDERCRVGRVESDDFAADTAPSHGSDLLDLLGPALIDQGLESLSPGEGLAITATQTGYRISFRTADVPEPVVVDSLQTYSRFERSTRSRPYPTPPRQDIRVERQGQPEPASLVSNSSDVSPSSEHVIPMFRRSG